MSEHLTFYTAIIVIVAALMVIYSWLVFSSHTFNRRKKASFILSAFLLTSAAIFECLGYYGLELGEGYRVFTIAMTTFQFSFTFLALSCICFAIHFPKKRWMLLLLVLPALAGIVLSVVSAFTGICFYVTEKNVYGYGNAYWLLTAISIYYAILLFIVILYENLAYQRQDLVGSILLLFLLLGALVAQILNKAIRTDFLVGALCLALYTFLYNNIRLSIDPLTGLLNRFFLDNYNARKGKEYRLILFDLDDFKTVNDTYGHAYGDEVLKFIGKSVLKSFGKKGYIIRYGGDEFVCLITKPCSPDELKEMENSLFADLIAKRKENSRLPYVSYGVINFRGGDSVIDIFNNADMDLYDHKQENKEKRKNGK